MVLNISNIIFAVLVIGGFLMGIRLMQSPRTALWGNRLGAFSMLVAMAWALISVHEGPVFAILIYMIVGAVIGLALAQAVRMIHMPQTVALLNGFGGAASAFVAWSAISGYGGEGAEILFRVTSSLAVSAGALTFSGSVVAVLKLHGLAFRKPVHIKGHSCVLCIAVISAVLMIIAGIFAPGIYISRLALVAALLGLLIGCGMALRVGGADMPILISLLNSLSGVAAAVAGLAVYNIVLAGTGALVGVAGLILTGIMCRAMNRNVLSVLTGFRPDSGMESSGTRKDFVPSDAPDSDAEQDVEEKTEKPDPARVASEILPGLLRSAKRVMLVPGYGMAVAQAQLEVRNLANALEQRGADVKFAIHPVAGRMPGHMNVLLAEAGIDYEKLLDIEAANPLFADVDLAIAIGACDVINPAANTVEGTPISGMPILDVEKSENIIICNMDEKPGYSGVENLLYERSNVITFWGDASRTVPQLTAMLG